MSEKFNGRYRIPSARASWWDYTNNGAYFITICTKNRRHFFGGILDGEMHLSHVGEVAHEFWAGIPQHFPFVELGEFVIMPNHVHGILVINHPNDPSAEIVETLESNVSTIPPTPTSDTPPKNEFMASISPKSGSVSSIIRSYKSEVTKFCRRFYDRQFGWQARFHDVIIRDEAAYQQISQYIRNNPGNWDEDMFSN